MSGQPPATPTPTPNATVSKKSIEDSRKALAAQIAAEKQAKAAQTAPTSSSQTQTQTTPASGQQAKTTPPAQPVKVKPTADTFLKAIKTGWAEVVALIVTEIADDPERYMFQGGLSPVDRRVMILADQLLKVTHIKWFVATCELRGHHIRAFAKKTDATAQALKELQDIVQFKGDKKKNETGKVSVVAWKVALSDVFIAFRKSQGAAKFKEESYKGICPVEYQWNGSLASMYMAKEDTDEEAVFLDYCAWYEDFQAWYLGVRSKAAALNKNNKDYTPKTPKEIQDAKDKSRGYYRLALGSFSRDTRRAWAKGDFTVEVTKGITPSETLMENILSGLN